MSDLRIGQPSDAPGEDFARPLVFPFPHATGTPEEYREALRRYVLDFGVWLDGFLAGAPDGGPALPWRVTERARADVRAWFAPMLKALRNVPIEEHPEALASAAAAAAGALARHQVRREAP